ncbi:unnamed protein product [Camellia sinensis]
MLAMNNRRDYRPSKAALFDSIEEGGIRVSSPYSQEIDECSNDSAINSLQDRVFFLKRLKGDMQWRAITGNEMDASRGIMSGTIDRFKMGFWDISCMAKVEFLSQSDELQLNNRILMLNRFAIDCWGWHEFG